MGSSLSITVEEGIKMQDLPDRISVEPAVCHGQPCIKGTRIMVYLVLELLESGLAPEGIIYKGVLSSMGK